MMPVADRATLLSQPVGTPLLKFHAYVADVSMEDWIPDSLKRDQAITLNLAVVQDVLGRIVALKENPALYEDTLLKNPDYMTAPQ